MTSYASEMPSSPGFIPRYNRYNRPWNNNVGCDDQKEQQQLSSVHEENLRLKKNLTRVQTEYEELRDESNYQRAKVSELSDIVASSSPSSSSPSSFPSFPSSNYNSNSGNECGETTVHNSLIAKSLENAELTLSVDKLKIELHNSEVKLEELQFQKRANNKLLLEMSDVVRTLNSVHIEYDSTSSPNDNINNNEKHLTVQQTSIKNIKLKVEAILKDRELLARRCRELEEEAYSQQQKVNALEAQFHVVNTTNLSKGVAFGDAATHTSVGSSNRSAAPHSPYSSTYSVSTNLTPVMMSEDDTMYSGGGGGHNNHYSPRSVTNASEFVRQSKELARQKQREEEQAKELVELKKSQRTQIDTISRLKVQNDRTFKLMQGLKEELNSVNEDKQDAVIKRDEFKENLRDIILHYKELGGEHEVANEQLETLQSYVNKLETELQETKDQQQNLQKELEEKKEQEEQQLQETKDDDDKSEEGHDETEEITTTTPTSVAATATAAATSSETILSCEMEDLIVAYSGAMKKIESLETRLDSAGRAAMSAHGKKDMGDRHYRDAINRYKKMERERNEFQRKLDRALEETRLAKFEAQKEREESKHVRRRLTAYLQRKQDDEILSGGCYTKPYTQKSTTYTPLSIEELMKKDFA